MHWCTPTRSYCTNTLCTCCSSSVFFRDAGLTCLWPGVMLFCGHSASSHFMACSHQLQPPTMLLVHGPVHHCTCRCYMQCSSQWSLHSLGFHLFYLHTPCRRDVVLVCPCRWWSLFQFCHNSRVTIEWARSTQSSDYSTCVYICRLWSVCRLGWWEQFEFVDKDLWFIVTLGIPPLDNHSLVPSLQPHQ